ncbi:MAG: MBL fold metallo-hydrolase [Chlorobiales bacterium]|nr:MBL fold metallo-hydrolase [Chlorobiales bacterium]
MSIDFEFEDNSIKVSGLPLWLDSSSYRSDKSPVRRALNFTSHAHADHIGNHRCIICSPQTLELLKVRQKVEKSITPSWGDPIDIAGAKVTLFPAGHVLGSAQILIEKGGRRICYTGDFRLGKGLTTEECHPVECDVLLMESTYGHPRYQFPERHELLESLEEFVERCFDSSLIPVILGYTLGKAQEAVKALENLGYGVLVHPSIMKICKIYEKLGVSFSNVKIFGSGPIGRRVIVFPPQKSAREKLGIVGEFRTAILTGWSIDSWRKKIFGADEAIPYSDHCDYSQLLETARLSKAKKIYTHHGDAERLALLLQSEGFDAEPLIPSKQQRLF